MTIRFVVEVSQSSGVVTPSSPRSTTSDGTRQAPPHGPHASGQQDAPRDLAEKILHIHPELNVDLDILSTLGVDLLPLSVAQDGDVNVEKRANRAAR